ncbi:MAG TPA: PQQ-binding-like beta-propeller repeat protein, partial [Pirellulaceae bacterium]|nr:PQQ-binding-like beta-propeller repeat protein [Pirellulaceae bacterium]
DASGYCHDACIAGRSVIVLMDIREFGRGCSLAPGLFVLAVLALPGLQAQAGDWPQILGANRDGKAAADEKLLESWPAAGPKVLWRQKLGSGYAGVAVAEGKVIAFHRVGDVERVEAFDSATGKSLWKADFEANYSGGIDADKGPRCVPLVAGEKVYVFGAAGDLHAVGLADGKRLWTRNLYADYEGSEGYFGAGSTPILVGGKLIVNVGGRGAGLVALDPATGKTAWQATDEAASYSSPTAVRFNSGDRALFITRLNCVLVDPKTGNAQTLVPFGQRGPTVNAATPLIIGGKMFLTSSYGVGALYSKFDTAGSQEVWANDDTLSSQYATPVEQGGFLYGIHGREDVGVAELRCVEAATGKVRWSQADYGVAHLILADGKLLIQSVEGRIALAAADSGKYRELATHQLTREPTRALPALANGRLCVRTGSGGGELICLQVGR